MATTLIINIKLLVNTPAENKLLRGKELSKLPCIANAYLIIEDGIITGIGDSSEIQNPKSKFKNIIDATGQYVLPAWCDSHTHLVFAASREEEFVDKIKGLSYVDIAAKGGGILNSAKKLHAATETELFNLAWKRLEEVSKPRTDAMDSNKALAEASSLFAK